MMKIKEIFEDVIWNIGAFLRQPIIPQKSVEWVVANDCSYSGISANRKWTYYWYGDFKTGYQVKVDSYENAAYVKSH